MTAASSDGYRSPGAALIAAERQRQIAVERWTFRQDDALTDGALVDAALAYASLVTFDDGGEWAMQRWPFRPRFFKPSDDQMHNLVRAGALLAAEIDRMIRASNPR